MSIIPPLINTLFTRALAVTTILLLGVTSPAPAKDKAGSGDSPLGQLYDCQRIENPQQRLACYDKAVSSLHAAEDKKELVTIDAKSARKIRREAFGFNLPSLPKLGLPKIGLGGKTDTLIAPVKTVRKSGRDFVFTLENGQVWRQTGGPTGYIPKGKLTARIRALKLGGYMMSVTNGKMRVKGMKVRRIK